MPTSTRMQPLWRSTSGTRKPPPISTASARETMTSRPEARAVSPRRTAEALLFTARAASAPVNWRRSDSSWACLDPRRPDSRSNSRLEYPRAVSSTARMAAELRGARPRLVWMTTPVALITRRGSALTDSSTRRHTRDATSSSPAAVSPCRTRALACSSSCRTRSTTQSRLNVEATSATSGVARTLSTLGKFLNCIELCGDGFTAEYSSTARPPVWTNPTKLSRPSTRSRYTNCAPVPDFQSSNSRPPQGLTLRLAVIKNKAILGNHQQFRRSGVQGLLGINSIG